MPLKNNYNRQIVKLAAPAILSNITVPLLGLCDTTIAGHLSSVSALGSIAVGSMMLNMIIWLMGFLRMGTTGLTAGCYGAADYNGCKTVLYRSLIIAFAISLIVIILQSPLKWVLLILLTPEGDIQEGAAVYYQIIVWSIPAQLGIMAFTGWFIGLQNTTIPMLIAIGMNLINIPASIIFAISCGLGIKGIALGTLMSNWIGLIVSALASKYLASKFPIEDNIVSTIKWQSFFHTNGNLFIRSAFLLAVSMAMTAYGSRMGEVTLGVNTVMMQFFLFFSYFIDGFAFAGEAMVGKYRGMKDYVSLRKSVVGLLYWGGGVALLFTIIYLIGNSFISSLITNVESVRTGLSEMRVFIIVIPFLTFIAFIFDGVYIGLNKTGMMLMSTMAGAVTFFTINYWLNFPVSNNIILWISFLSYLFIRGLVLALDYLRMKST